MRWTTVIPKCLSQHLSDLAVNIHLTFRRDRRSFNFSLHWFPPPRNLLIAFLLSLNIVNKSMLNKIYLTERLSYRTVFFNLLAIDAFLLLLPPDGNCYRRNSIKKNFCDDITQTLHTLSFDERWSVLCCIKYSASCLPIWQKTSSYVLIGSFVTVPWRKSFDKGVHHALIKTFI